MGDVVFVPCKLRPLAALTGRLKHILYKHLCVCATHWLAQPKNNGCLSGPKSSVTLPKAWQSRAEMDSGIVSAIYFGPLQFLKGNQSTGQRHFREPCSNMSDEPGCNTQTQGGGRRGRKKKMCAQVAFRAEHRGEQLGAQESDGRCQSFPTLITSSHHFSILSVSLKAAAVSSPGAVLMPRPGGRITAAKISLGFWTASQALFGNCVIEPPIFIAL